MNILLIDDDEATRRSLSLFLTELGHDVTCASDGREGLNLFNKGIYHLVFSDIMMPNMDGFELLRHIKAGKNSMVDIVFVTGHGDIESSIKALRAGAYDYLQKPVNIEELAAVVDRISEHLSLKITNEELTNKFEEQVRERVSETESQLEKYRSAFRDNLGLNISIHSNKLGEIYLLAGKFHKSPSVPILIEGETGTGKELLARYIHFGPDMSAKPFVALNCAAIPTDLFESELFGHEAGAFTGASSISKKGQMEIAGDGALLLDEIGEMPLSAQVKLLRVLQEREFYRVGGVKRMSFRARIIASTNKSLNEEVKKGTFRSDLYHRLNVGYLRIPPLRELTEEIIPLAYDFLTKACNRHGNKSIKGFTPDAEKFLERQAFPGNIRQLENAIERVVLLYEETYIESEHLRFLDTDSADENISANDNKIDFRDGSYCVLPKEGIDLDKVITRLIEEAMRMTGGNKTIAAKLLNISPRTISRRLERAE